MKETGILRRIDELGRIVVPKEIRKKLKIREGDNLDIYVTGSNAKFLSKDIITEFRGRGWQIHINPLSFKEFKQVFSGTNDEAYNIYSVYGGLPKLIDFKKIER